MKKIIVSVVLFILLVGSILIYYFFYRNDYIVKTPTQQCKYNKGYQLCYLQLLESVWSGNYLTEKFNTSVHCEKMAHIINTTDIPIRLVSIDNIHNDTNNLHFGYQIQDVGSYIKNIKQIAIIFISPRNKVIIDNKDVLVIGDEVYITNDTKVQLLHNLFVSQHENSKGIIITVDWLSSSDYEKVTEHTISNWDVSRLNKIISSVIFNK